MHVLPIYTRFDNDIVFGFGVIMKNILILLRNGIRNVDVNVTLWCDRWRNHMKIYFPGYFVCNFSIFDVKWKLCWIFWKFQNFKSMPAFNRECHQTLSILFREPIQIAIFWNIDRCFSLNIDTVIPVSKIELLFHLVILLFYLLLWKSPEFCTISICICGGIWGRYSKRLWDITDFPSWQTHKHIHKHTNRQTYILAKCKFWQVINCQHLSIVLLATCMRFVAIWVTSTSMNV